MDRYEPLAGKTHAPVLLFLKNKNSCKKNTCTREMWRMRCKTVADNEPTYFVWSKGLHALLRCLLHACADPQTPTHNVVLC